MAYNISYIYQVIDKFSPALKKIEKAQQNFGKRIAASGQKLKNFSDKLGGVQSLLAGVGAGAGLALVSKKAMEFEDIMTDVKKVMTFKNEDQFKQFREGLLKTAVEMGKAPVAIGEIAEQGGKLGILPKQMGEFLKVVSRTSVAFGVLEGDAAETLGKLKSMFEMTVPEVGNLMDAVNYLADNTTANSERMIDIIKRTSGTFKTYKMPPEIAAGWAAFADQIETSSEVAASGMNMMMSRMTRIPGMLEKMMEDPDKAVKGMLETLSKMDKVKRTKYIYKTFGEYAAKFVMKAVESTQLLNETMGLVTDKAKFTGSMMKELTKKLATSGTAWKKIKAVMDVVAITLGDVLTPYLKEISPHIINAAFAFKKWTEAHPTITKMGLAMTALIAVVTPLVALVALLAPGIIAIGEALAGATLVGFLGGVAMFGAVAAAVIGVGAAIYQVWKNWDYFKKYFISDLIWLGKMLKENLAFQAIAVAIVGVGAAVAPVFTAIGLAVAGVGAAVKAVIDNWDYLVDDFKRGIEFIKRGFAEFKEGLNIVGEGFKQAGGKVKEMVTDNWLTRKLGLSKEKPLTAPGVAAQNTIATQSTLNGSITVAAEQGTAVKQTRMKTDVPGNLGFNMAAVGM